MNFEEIVIMAGIVVTSVSFGYMLCLCHDIRETAKQAIKDYEV